MADIARELPARGQSHRTADPSQSACALQQCAWNSEHTNCFTRCVQRRVEVVFCLPQKSTPESRAKKFSGTFKVWLAVFRSMELTKRRSNRFTTPNLEFPALACCSVGDLWQKQFADQCSFQVFSIGLNTGFTTLT
jgi:hypothetical protein